LGRLENDISFIKYLIEVSNKETDECEMIIEKMQYIIQQKNLF
jgi:hypothetical protein